MEKFLATGVHPEVERARAAQQEVVPPLPERRWVGWPTLLQQFALWLRAHALHFLG